MMSQKPVQPPAALASGGPAARPADRLTPGDTADPAAMFMAQRAMAAMRPPVKVAAHVRSAPAKKKVAKKTPKKVAKKKGA